MATFFEDQDRARRNTRVLILLMALGVLAMGAAIYALLVAVEFQSAGRMLEVGQSPRVFQPLLLIACVFGTASLVGVASAGRTLSLSGGGRQVAEMMGGRLVTGAPRDALEKRLLNVVEEMAIASGMPVPMVFVLEGEMGINAFAAGYATDDAAIAVTRGCLEKLTRDELQGVIGHEFSHVLNGDMSLNMRLMGIVFGIVCLGLLGRLIMRFGRGSRYASSSRRGASSGATLFLLGLGVVVIGAIGELCGKLIKAAVSRQREFLADASAVQFTRNPSGIAGALKKIGGWHEGAAIHARNADEASHFFFGDIHKRFISGSMLATHPPLAERIRRIDPSFDGRFPSVGEGVAQPDLKSEALGLATPEESAAANDGAKLADEAVQRVGTLQTPGPDEGRKLLAALSENLRASIENPLSAASAVFALLLSDDVQVQERQLHLIEQLSGAALRQETLKLGAEVHELRRRDRLSFVSLLTPSLRSLSTSQRLSFSKTLQALIDADSQVSIFEYILSETLRERLAVDSNARHRSRVRVHSLVAVHSEIQLVLSLLAHTDAFDAEAASQAFRAGTSRLPGRIELLEDSDRLLFGLGAALISLRAAAPKLCGQIIDASAHVVLHDQRVTDDEYTLLRALCDALGCPMPLMAGA